MKHGDLYFNPLDIEVPMHIPMFGINYCHSDYRNIRKNSEITVVAYVLNGQGSIQVDSLCYSPKQGDVFILPKGSYHEVSADPNQQQHWTYLWYNLRGNSLRLLETFRLQSTILVPDVPLEPLFRKSFELMQNEKPDNEQLHIQLLMNCTEIMAHLANILEKRKSILPFRVQQMKQYLDRQDLESFHSGRMSRHFAMSFKQMNRLFKKEIGTTVYDYIMIKKMNTAKLLLMDTDLSVSEIAYRIGYSEPHYFSNLFKKKTGFSPTDYRKSMTTE
ncbi:Arabinose operon regulatory protein [Paenibacillus konkukensis]|uniref:Arabinose operon regulatory protein n=1 Tax=Paenibacillus konkukensis TaxID=2020716 RepID=A0ABY4RFJ9_9BACL|nr:AraC family transcriptional regulator [Paenibacillus konkukensis]UQZ81038.1 Arabinose operon regulatory protein [Paenibacillus konkukensis]